MRNIGTRKLLRRSDSVLAFMASAQVNWKIPLSLGRRRDLFLFF